MAEGLFRHHVTRLGIEQHFTIDSCGTGGWHAGELPDPRMRQTAEKNGIILTHRARQLQVADFDRFDHLLVMDEQNYKDVVRVNAKMAGKVRLMSDLSDTHKGKIIPDPYFGDIKGFEQVFQLLDQVSTEIAQNFLQQYR